MNEKLEYIKNSLASIIEEAEDTDNPFLDDLIALYDRIDLEGGVMLNE